MKVKVSEVLAMFEQRRKWNSVPFQEIEWVDDAGNLIPCPQSERDQFEFTGLSNVDFVRCGLFPEDRMVEVTTP